MAFSKALLTFLTLSIPLGLVTGVPSAAQDADIDEHEARGAYDYTFDKSSQLFVPRSDVPQPMLATRRERAMARLGPRVRRYLETLKEDEYEIDLTMADEVDEYGRINVTAALAERGATGGGHEQCNPGTVAMTFDDGPYQYHEQIINEWSNRGHQLTFMVNGYNYDCAYNKPYPSLLRQTLAKGHVIGHHTWNHVYSSKTHARELREQLDLVDEMLLKTVGVAPRLFRFPYGDYNDEAMAIVKSHGLEVIGWNFDFGDSDGATVGQSKSVVRSINHDSQALILAHETKAPTAGELSTFTMNHLEAKGLKSISANRCIGLGKSPYRIRAKPGKRDATWTCAGKPAPGSS